LMLVFIARKKRVEGTKKNQTKSVLPGAAKAIRAAWATGEMARAQEGREENIINLQTYVCATEPGTGNRKLVCAWQS